MAATWCCLLFDMPLPNELAKYRSAYKFFDKDSPKYRTQVLNQFARHVEDRLIAMEKEINDLKDRVAELDDHTNS